MDISATGPIGVLDLQGGVQEHLEHFRRLGVAAVPVKDPSCFADLAGLVIPGGESTCLRRLIRNFEFDRPLLAAHKAGLKIWGTCAGAILVAAQVVGEEPGFGLIDISVARNAFGSQLDSFHVCLPVPKVSAEPVELTFIRAPKIVRAGKSVDIILDMGDYIAAAENDTVLATIFHPELTACTAFHAYFARKCGLRTEAVSMSGDAWTRTAWMRFSRISRPVSPPQ